MRSKKKIVTPGIDKKISISPKHFELLVLKHLKNIGEHLNNLKVIHNVKSVQTDGTYQIDVYAEFEALGGKFKVLTECKNHKNSIKRDVVMLLHSKLHSTGAQKGMIYATTPFQKGAIQYAEKHGIALIKVIYDDEFEYITKSMDKNKTVLKPVDPEDVKFTGALIRENRVSIISGEYIDYLHDFIFGK